jgi:fumarate reductase iron-sulfur subunit
MSGKERMIDIIVERFDPERDEAPRSERFTVPYDDDTSLLDALNDIKDRIDGSLTFRWSCRMAICGSCGKMVDGQPRLSCKTFLRDYAPGPVRVEALHHFPIIKDLVVDQSGFLDKLRDGRTWLLREDDRPLAAGPHRQTPKQRARIESTSACINCLLCYAACPQYGLESDFAGPALLALVERYNSDSRDQGKAERMPLINAEDGVWSCTLVGSCSAVCPKGVDPAAAINRNKLESTKDYFLRFLKPGPGGGE